MSFKGTLKVVPTKKGCDYKACFINAKGKTNELPIPVLARHFSDQDAKDGAPILVDVNATGQLTKVTIVGSEVNAPAQKPSPPPRTGGGGYRPSGAAFPTQPYRQNPTGQQRPALRNATAPYNFIPYDVGMVIKDLPTEQEGPFFSGTIRCRLEALTPLLVAGPQKEGSKDRDFLTVAGQPIIPGSSLKGVLRSIVEVISYSRLWPVNEGNLFWRNISNEKYRGNFSEAQRAGYLVREGATYYIHTVGFEPITLNSQPSKPGTVVKTGLMPGKKHDYLFYPLEKNNRIPVDVKIVNAFLDQMTKFQIEKWESCKNRLSESNGVPVFYLPDKHGGVEFFGLAKFFRIPYLHRPAELVGKEGVDFAARLFGTVNGEARKGRVSISPGRFTAIEQGGVGYDVVLGQPHPTCLAHYLVQDNKQLGTLKNNSNINNPAYLYNYNDRPLETLRLRGHKWYWHRNEGRPTLPPGVSPKVISVLHPLGVGSTAVFEVRLDRVTLEELGAVLEALDLPEGHAHKFGMGKPLGLGSVRISVDAVEVCTVRDRYVSLAARFGAGTAIMEPSEQNKAREAFKSWLLRNLPSGGGDLETYELLPQIRALRRMMNFLKRPGEEFTRNMDMKDYAKNVLLPDPLEIPTCYERWPVN